MRSARSGPSWRGVWVSGFDKGRRVAEVGGGGGWVGGGGWFRYAPALQACLPDVSRGETGYPTRRPTLGEHPRGSPQPPPGPAHRRAFGGGCTRTSHGGPCPGCRSRQFQSSSHSTSTFSAASHRTPCSERRSGQFQKASTAHSHFQRRRWNLHQRNQKRRDDSLRLQACILYGWGRCPVGHRRGTEGRPRVTVHLLI